MGNKINIIRGEYLKGITTFKNAVLNDRDITLEAKGLYVWLKAQTESNEEPVNLDISSVIHVDKFIELMTHLSDHDYVTNLDIDNELRFELCDQGVEHGG